MSARKSERLLNLIFLLLVSRQFLTKAQIRDAIDGYREARTDESFDRMFERDKEDLRELGITVEFGSHDPFFGDEQGYRILRDTAELADIELTREEAAVVGLATQVWEHAGLASWSTTALVKLKSVGVDVDTTALRMAEPRLSTDEHAFDAMWEAATGRIPVSFVYARPGGESMQRHLQPWGIVSWRDRWYVGGFDTDREAPRVFRLSRIVGEVTTTGSPGDYDVPPGTDMRQVAASLFEPDPDRVAVLRIRVGRGQSLRRSATVVEHGEQFDTVEVTYHSNHELAAHVASYGPDVVAVQPADLRAAVVAHLRLAASGQLGDIA